MSSEEEVRREIMFTIGKFLKDKMPSLNQILIGWPASNKTYDHPTMSITTKVPGYQPDMVPYEWKDQRGQIDAARYQYLYVYGEYNSTLQLDIWASNKEERYRLI